MPLTSIATADPTPTARRDEPEGDAVAECRREVAGRHDPDDLSVGDDRAVGTRRSPAFGGDADEVTVDAPGLLGGECGAATEVFLGPGDNPAETGLQRRDPRAEFVAMQRKGGLEAQRVAGTKSGRQDSATTAASHRAAADAAGTAISTPGSPV